MDCRLKTLNEKAEEFDEFKDTMGFEEFEALDPLVWEPIVANIGTYLDPNSSDLNGGHFLDEFKSLMLDEKKARWAEWLTANPFRGELDRQLDRFIPGVFRGRPAQEALLTYKQVELDLLKASQS